MRFLFCYLFLVAGCEAGNMRACDNSCVYGMAAYSVEEGCICRDLSELCGSVKEGAER